MSEFAEFDKLLNEIKGLKAPGVSGSRIKKLTELAIQNVRNESEIVSKVSNFCKDLPISHKLGGLYIIDSIARGYQSQARKIDDQRINYNNVNSMTINKGTFISGLLGFNNNIKSTLSTVLNGLIDSSQKDKIKKLVEIWSKANTFDKKLLDEIVAEYYGNSIRPPPNSNITGPTDANSILKSLASLAGPAPVDNSNVYPASNSNGNNSSYGNNSTYGNSTPVNSLPPPPAPPAVAPPTGIPDPNAVFQMLQQMQQSQGNNNVSSPPQGNRYDNNNNQYTNRGRNSYGQNNYDDQNGYSSNSNNENGYASNNYGANNNNSSYGNTNYGNTNYGENNFGDNNRGRGNYDGGRYGNNGNDGGRYGNNNYGNNNHGNNNNDSNNGYDSYVRGGGRGRRGNNFNNNNNAFRRNRSRSPNRQESTYDDREFEEKKRERQQKINTAAAALLNPGETNEPGTFHYRPKPVSYDNTLPAGSFKVLSRTVFIGGITSKMDERTLGDMIRPYAEVQSVILNIPKKHAFVKVFSRQEALNVISSFNKDGQYNLRLRWGVGFGPRDCCDYQHGISVIPIARLTDADKRWVTTAEWGGTGGKPLVPGVVIEEPDIEIGKGVSSKAISKKMPTDASRNGPKSTKPGEPDDIYTDPLNVPETAMPSMPQGENPLANLFGGIAPSNNDQPTPPPPVNVPTQTPNAAAVAALLGSIPGLPVNNGNNALNSLLQNNGNNQQ